MLERRREALEEGHGALGREESVAPRCLLDFADGLPDALDGRLRPPAERMAPEPGLEGPLVLVGLLRHGSSVPSSGTLHANAPVGPECCSFLRTGEKAMKLNMKLGPSSDAHKAGDAPAACRLGFVSDARRDGHCFE